MFFDSFLFYFSAYVVEFHEIRWPEIFCEIFHENLHLRDRLDIIIHSLLRQADDRVNTDIIYHI